MACPAEGFAPPSSGRLSQIRSDRFEPPQPPRASACGMGIVHTFLTQEVSDDRGSRGVGLNWTASKPKRDLIVSRPCPSFPPRPSPGPSRDMCSLGGRAAKATTRTSSTPEHKRQVVPLAYPSPSVHMCVNIAQTATASTQHHPLPHNMAPREPSIHRSNNICSSIHAHAHTWAHALARPLLTHTTPPQ